MDESKLYRALMAMTEAEAAALDFLANLDQAREHIREAIDRGESV